MPNDSKAYNFDDPWTDKDDLDLTLYLKALVNIIQTSNTQSIRPLY